MQDIKPGLGQRQVRREGISQWPPGAHSLVRKTEGAQTQELYRTQASVRGRRRRRKDYFQRDKEHPGKLSGGGDTVKTCELVEFQQLQRELSRSRKWPRKVPLFSCGMKVLHYCSPIPWRMNIKCKVK